MPLGWFISIYRKGFEKPADGDRFVNRIAVWQTGLSGLRWIDDLVAEGRAIFVGGDGYPYRYAALARDIAPKILSGPPDANQYWISDPGDILTAGWIGRTQVDRATVEKIKPDEMLYIEAWDES